MIDIRGAVAVHKRAVPKANSVNARSSRGRREEGMAGRTTRVVVPRLRGAVRRKGRESARALERARASTSGKAPSLLVPVHCCVLIAAE